MWGRRSRKERGTEGQREKRKKEEEEERRRERKGDRQTD